MNGQQRFTALIGYLNRPTIDGRTWRPVGDVVELRSHAVPLLTLMDGLIESVLVGYITRVIIRVDGAVYASGKADPATAEALNEGTSMLLADLDHLEQTSVNADEVSYLRVVLTAAHVGTPAQFAWRLPA